MDSAFIPYRPSPSETRKCTQCNRELDIDSFRASKSGKLLKRCRPCYGDKRVLESPQKAPPPPSKRTRNYASPTKASLARNRPTPTLQAPTAAPAPAPTFLLRGKDSQDDNETAAAREEQVNIRRRHRLATRHGEEHSPTPSLNTLIARRPPQFESPLGSPITRSLAPSPVPVPRSTAVSPAPPVSPVPPPSIPDPFLETQLNSSIPDPFLETQPYSNPLSEEPFPEEEWQMHQSFHKQLDKDTRVTRDGQGHQLEYSATSQSIRETLIVLSIMTTAA